MMTPLGFRFRISSFLYSLGKYDAFTFDHKTKEQVDVKLKVGEAQTSFFPVSHDDSNRGIISTLTPSRRTLKLKISWESQRA